MLTDRQRELNELNHILGEPNPQLLAVSGRRRLGKTTLLHHWAKESQHPAGCKVAECFDSATIHCQLSIVNYPLSTIHCQLSIVNYF